MAGTLMTDTPPDSPDALTQPAERPTPPVGPSLLNRIASHLKAQNWTAIAIEFLVVVAGVFLAFQLNNWNEARQAARDEQRIAGQLQAELARAISTREDWLVDFERHWNTFGDAVMAVEDERGSQVLTEDECIAIWTSHIFDFDIANIATLDEILSTGAVARLQNVDLRKALLDFDAFRERTRTLFAFIRQDFANIVDGYAAAFPRRLTAKPTLATIEEAVIPIASKVDCKLDLIRRDPAIRNRLVSNLARTTAILQTGNDELRRMQGLSHTLADVAP